MILSDKVAIVTGGARGVGRAIATKFTEEGCAVAIADILGDRARETAAELSASGKDVLAIECDHTNSGQVQEMVNQVIGKYGKIDILVNVAGAPSPARAVADCSEEEWHRTININLTGPFLCSKYVVPHMKERKSGSIIHFSSIAGIRPNSLMVAYAAAKAGVLGLMYSMALELAPYNIRVNAILPDMVRTEFMSSLMGRQPAPAKVVSPEERAAMIKKQDSVFLMGRAALPEDFMGTALFLASDMSAYITGIQIFLGGKYPDGGPPAPAPPK
jgi:NAD(P)-dependent dehydrogenase (short-subunit alcohol dehydrogenase family)